MIMKRPAVFVLLLSLALSACAQPEPPSEVTAVVAASAGTVSATEEKPEAVPQGPIRLNRLPRRGLALSSKWGTRFVDLSGTVIDEVPELQGAGNRGAPELWFQLGRTYLRLDLDTDALLPVPRKTARRHLYGEGSEPDLPIPADTPRVNGMVVGHWRYAIPSPSGDVLGQWSGECEVPTAYWIEPGGEPRIITGETDLGEAPTSEVLGWTGDGRAIVYLGPGYCSEGSPPGVYAFTAPGAGELVYQTHHFNHVEMWER